MIGYLEGITILVKHSSIIVNVRGVGYEVFLPQNLLSQQSSKQNIALYIHTHVTDQSLTLYGFRSTKELEIFELLLTVSGIGPKSALNILNYGVEKIRQSIVEAEINFFTQIPRLGTKNAQKIIIELKNKLGGVKELDLNQDLRNKELVEALISMDFSRSEISEVLKRIPADMQKLEEKIRFALKNLAKK